MAEIDEMKKDPKLFALLMAFSIKQKTDENILFYFDKGNMGGLFPKYIKAGAPKEINIDSKLRTRMTTAFNTKNEADFKKDLVIAKKECLSLCSQIINGFKATPEYKFLEAREAAEKNAAKAMKVLGISNAGKDKLLDAIAYLKIGNAAAGKKCLEQLAAAEKMQEKADMIMKNLKASGLI